MERRSFLKSSLAGSAAVMMAKFARPVAAKAKRAVS
ncbi:MAG: twin-arginine translocation signal domain-containing protein [Phycisphaerales bacterium]|nr:MAG: twin-arginine translocation signal domain-containing protein [Phycisphaerales bacterium]